MKYLWVTAIVFCTAFSAQADSAKSKFHLNTRGGINIGLADEYTPGGDDPGYAFTLASGVKFTPSIGITLDFGLASLGQGKSQFTHLFLMVHGYWQTSYVNISLGGGVGYSQITQDSSDEGYNDTLTPSWIPVPPVKATLTALYPVVAGLELGLAVDFIYNGEMVSDVGYPSTLVGGVSQLQVGLAAAYTF